LGIFNLKPKINELFSGLISGYGKGVPIYFYLQRCDLKIILRLFICITLSSDVALKPVYTNTNLCMHTHTHTHTEREREREREILTFLQRPLDVSSAAGVWAPSVPDLSYPEYPWHDGTLSPELPSRPDIGSGRYKCQYSRHYRHY